MTTEIFYTVLCVAMLLMVVVLYSTTTKEFMKMYNLGFKHGQEREALRQKHEQMELMD